MLYTNLPSQSDRLFLPSATPSPVLVNRENFGETRSSEIRFHPGNYHSQRYCSSSWDGRTIRRISPMAKQTWAEIRTGLTTRLLRYDSRSRQSAASHSPSPVANLHRFNREFDIYSQYQFIRVQRSSIDLFGIVIICVTLNVC